MQVKIVPEKTLRNPVNHDSEQSQSVSIETGSVVYLEIEKQRTCRKTVTVAFLSKQPDNLSIKLKR
jgi:hypothetical protein